MKINFKHCPYLFMLLLFSITAHVGYCQKSKRQLENEKRENLRKIRETNRILRETTHEKNATLGLLNALNEQVLSHRGLINTISKEIRTIEADITDIGSLTLSMETDLKNLKDEYATMVYAASKAGSYNKLMFVFSSKTFNQFVMRIKYLKQYAQARREQVNLIEDVRSTLLAQQILLDQKKKEKEGLLLAQLSESEKLKLLQGQQKQIVKQLSAKEKELKHELEEHREANRRLEKLISDLVRREIRRAARAERQARAARRRVDHPAKDQAEEPNQEPESVDDNKIALTPEAAFISSSFAGSKSRLIWPVASGFISGRFGKHEHPVLKNIIVDNLGINIQTNQDEKVRAVFEGEVGFVATVPGLNGKIVSLQHGDYFTVYSNLKSVNVRPGQKIKMKAILGEVFTDKNGVSELQFQIWKNNDRLNPQNWLYNK